MKYLISLLSLLFSCSFAYDISQDFLDQKFDYCLSNTNKTEREQAICEQFWIPVATGEKLNANIIDDLEHEYKFNPDDYSKEKLAKQKARKAQENARKEKIEAAFQKQLELFK